MSATGIRLAPFTIAVPETVLDDLRERLDRAVLAADFANADWRYGVNGDYLRELVDYWRTSFDWHAQERRMNAYAHYRTVIEDVPIHFLHARSSEPHAMPLILSHGWPWTFWDFEKVIGPLTDPVAHGGDAADAFDVVIPSLPGYGFSTPLLRPGVDAVTTGDLWVRLMREGLGHDRFAAQGGDWGLRVTTGMAARHPEHLIGIHLTGAPLAGFTTRRPWADAFAGLYDDPKGPIEEILAWERGRAAHVAVHGLDPQTLAYAMQDSPVGLCAWILERRRTWSDCGGDVESAFSKDELLTTVTLYWVTQSFGTSARFYWEGLNRVAATPERVDVPTGFSVFRSELPPGFTLDHLAGRFDIRMLEEHAEGGHFAPAENPDAVVHGIRTLFRPLRTD